MLNIFDELERNNLADVKIWRAMVHDADEGAASEIASIMRNVDNRFELPENQKEYKLSRHRLFGNVFIWYSRGHICIAAD
jgi:hypothetical protein